MKKLKKWYNKMLVKKYGGKNFDILEMFGEKRPFLFCLPLYSPSLYTYYAREEIYKMYIIDGMESEREKIINQTANDIKEIDAQNKEMLEAFKKSFGTLIDKGENK